MTTGRTARPSVGVRPAAVAGAFYPAEAARLRALVTGQLAEAARASTAHIPTNRPMGILVPHAGLAYSGVVAAAAWRLIAAPPSGSPEPLTIVILGTNHRAAWLDGIGAWDRGSWLTPLGAVDVDDDLAAAIVRLGPPFGSDLDAHREEHSIEVQLPFVLEVVPHARIVPLAVASGVGADAIAAGRRLGELVAARRSAGGRILLVISTDMAHYPSHDDATGVTALLLPVILALEPETLAAREAALRRQGIPDLACGMCGIEPAVVGLAALRAAGASVAAPLSAATSADVGGPRARTVGYLAVAFD